MCRHDGEEWLRITRRRLAHQTETNDLPVDPTAQAGEQRPRRDSGD